MRRFTAHAVTLLGSLLVLGTLPEASAGYVKGYTRKDGTYVAPYYRGGGGGSSSTYTPSTSVGIPCGNSYISAGKTCRIGTSTYKASNFSSCDEANENGFSNIPRGSEAYSPGLDRDADGIACESGNGEGNTPATTITPVLNASPVSTTVQGATGDCPTFRLTDSGLIVDVPAVFPNPATTTTTTVYDCGGTSITYGPGYSYRDIVYHSADWKSAWSKIGTDLGRSLEVSLGGRFELSNGQVSFNRRYDSIPLDNNLVIALLPDGRALQPVVFNGSITPVPLGTGRFTVLQKGMYDSIAYQQVTIDPVSNTITLTRTATWPK